MNKEEWGTTMRAMHRIHLALEDSCSLPMGAIGFPAGQDPTYWCETRVRQLADELERAVRTAKSRDVWPVQ